jgi:hypothetical protein
MDYHPHATDNALHQTDHGLPIFTVVATICVPDSPFPKKLSGPTPGPR